MTSLHTSSSSSSSSSTSPTPTPTPTPIPTPTSTTSPTSTTWTSVMPPGTTIMITSSYVTVAGGSTYTTQSLIPSIIPTQPSSTSNQRAAIIGGSAAGAAVFIIILIATIFYFRRKHFKRLRIMDAIMSGRNQARQRAMLLAGEDLDDIDLSHHPPSGRYRDYETPWDTGSPQGSMSDRSFIPPGFPSPLAPTFGGSISGASNPSIPTLYQARRSEAGSLFHEEVWPPPSERSRLIDPLLHSQEIDLSTIVDNVMGPSASSGQQQHPSVVLMNEHNNSPGVDASPPTAQRNKGI
ncbi:hypothetical protein V8B97DRAFT_524873 [Scleroderma yunnanense]